MNLCILLFLFKYVFSSTNDDSYNTYYGSNDVSTDDIIIEQNDDFFYTHNVLNMNYLRRRAIACNSATTNKVVDWTGVYTSPVKNAGFCLGAGWAFAAVDQVESDTVRIHGTSYKYILSPQQLLDCVAYNNGCSGGKIERAYDYLLTNGLEQSNNYPYGSFMGITQRCNTVTNLAVTKVSGYYNFLTGNEGCMARYVQTTGPLTVCLSTSLSWYTYTGGVMTLNSCPATSNINHCLQVVGVYPNVNGGYWKLKNSFGTGWGEQGHIRIAYGSNVCNIISNPIHTVTQVDF